MSSVISPPGEASIPSSAVSDHAVSLTLPGERYMGVARLVTAGVAARLDLSFDAIDDVQLAVELVLTGAFARTEKVTVTLVGDRGELSIAISPVAASTLTDTRAGYDGESRIALQTLLERLVDSVGIEPGPVPVVVLRKATKASRH
jgi:hypothetical protein